MNYMKQVIQRLEKALDIACEELVDSSKYDTESKVYFKGGKCKYACNMTKQEWKEYLLSEVKE